jgi:urease accessory protein
MKAKFGQPPPSAVSVPDSRIEAIPLAPPPSEADPADPADWLAWQLIDSAFPTGGFAHSSGLEAAWQQGEVANREELSALLAASLRQLGHATLPFTLATYDQPDVLPEADALCDAFTSNHVANRASRAQGRAFLTAIQRVFPQPDAPPLEAPCGHLAPVFGVCLRRLGLARRTTGRMLFFNHLRSLLAAAVRLNIVGPMEAQILTHRLAPTAEAILTECAALTLDQIAQTAPLLDVWQGAHDRLYSRLFQS